jgi:hypothetical protein
MLKAYIRQINIVEEWLLFNSSYSKNYICQYKLKLIFGINHHKNFEAISQQKIIF